jgi:N4-gp56 family major capsid protein
MADTLSTSTSLNNLLPIYLEKRMIGRLVPTERFYQFGKLHDLPMNMGVQMTFNGWTNLAAPSVTLSEGVANSLAALSSRKVNVSISQYGRGVKVTDLAAITTITDVVRDAVDILSTSAALAMDNVCQLAIFRNILSNTGTNANAKTILSAMMSSVASSFCANTGTQTGGTAAQFGFPAVFGTTASRLSATSSTAPTASARASVYSVRKARNRLSRLDAIPWADGYFVAVAHPNMLDTLGRDNNWQTWNQYTKEGQQTMYKGERGRVEQVRFVGSTNAPRYAVAAHSVNITAILGQEAFGVTRLDGGIKMLVKNPGPHSTDNPFDSYSTVAYKLNAVAAVLNPSAAAILFTEELLK